LIDIAKISKEKMSEFERSLKIAVVLFGLTSAVLSVFYLGWNGIFFLIVLIVVSLHPLYIPRIKRLCYRINLRRSKKKMEKEINKL